MTFRKSLSEIRRAA